MKLVAVYWYDAVADSGWQSPSDYDMEEKDMMAISVGRLIRITPEKIILAGSFGPDEDDDCNSWMVIPRGWVKEIFEVNLGPQLPSADWAAEVID